MQIFRHFLMAVPACLSVCSDVFTLTIRQISCHSGKLFILIAVGGDLYNVSHCLPSCVKNSHTKSDTEPSWHVILALC